MFLKRTTLCLRPIQTNFEASEGLPVKTKMKADTKLTGVMCCDCCLEAHSAIQRPFPAVAGATTALWTEPQTATGVVYFLQIRPVYVFFKQKTKKK